MAKTSKDKNYKAPLEDVAAAMTEQSSYTFSAQDIIMSYEDDPLYAIYVAIVGYELIICWAKCDGTFTVKTVDKI